MPRLYGIQGRWYSVQDISSSQALLTEGTRHLIDVQYKSTMCTMHRSRFKPGAAPTALMDATTSQNSPPITLAWHVTLLQVASGMLAT